MTQLDFSAIGERVAHYRKLNGWSGDYLAELAGNGISRSVIANIETRRKKDVSVEQAVALARALQVPLVALLMDMSKPESDSQIPRNLDGSGSPLPVATAARWFSGDYPAPSSEGLPSAVSAFGNIRRYRAFERALASWLSSNQRLRELRGRQAAGDASPTLSEWISREEADLPAKEEAVRLARERAIEAGIALERVAGLSEPEAGDFDG